MKKTIVDGKAENEFASTEEKLVIVLMALGKAPVRIEAEGTICTYYFDHEAVIDLANKVSCGNIGDISLPLVDLWAAQNIWRLNLSRARMGQ